MKHPGTNTPQAAAWQHSFDQQQACVLIPTYNNASSILAVVNDVRRFTNNIIIVNDGSTDNTLEQISSFEEELNIISYNKNRGKGYALKTGFRQALKSGYRYAITIDSDGQHYAHDLPVFLKKIAEQPDSLIIGARNMDQAHIPGKSTFGNRFSNFWFWVETGIRLPDTQSGYRLYPVAKLLPMTFFTRKYEFEIEVPVRAAWRGIPVLSAPVSVYYPPQSERISHFRPFKDFTRISVLNTVLTFTALLWIHPRNFILKLTKKQGWKDLYNQAFRDANEKPATKAWSIAFGIFMGIVPVWGFQLAIGIPLAVYFRLNKALFLIAANISIFPLTPVIWALSLVTGKLLLGYDDWTFAWKDISLQQFKEAGIAFFLGGTVLAVISSALAYFISIKSIKRGKH